MIIYKFIIIKIKIEYYCSFLGILSRKESFLAKLMGINAIFPEIGTPLIITYGVCVYGGVFYGLQNLED